MGISGGVESPGPALLRWEREFPAALDLAPLRQAFRPRVPSVRALREPEVEALVSAGAEILPDDCSAVVRAGNYGAAVRAPAPFSVTGEAGSWRILSGKVEVPGRGEAEIASPFLGGRFLKVSCGLRIFYPASGYHLLLTAPPNTWTHEFRVWTGLQATDYKDCESGRAGLRLFNTNLILEPLSPFHVGAGVVLATVYLVPRALALVEGSR